MTLNPYLVRARVIKAMKLADWLVDHEATPSQVANDPDLREAAVAATGVRKPSDECWAQVVGIVEYRTANPLPEPASCEGCGDTGSDVMVRQIDRRGYEATLCLRCFEDDSTVAELLEVG